MLHRHRPKVGAEEQACPALIRCRYPLGEGRAGETTAALVHSRIKAAQRVGVFAGGYEARPHQDDKTFRLRKISEALLVDYLRIRFIGAGVPGNFSTDIFL